MPAADQTLKTTLACLIALSLCGCARISDRTHALGWTSGLGLFGPSVGDIHGHIDQAAADGFSVIHLEQLDRSSRARPATATMRVTIKRGHQVPPIAVVKPGQAIRIENLDAIHHEIFSADAAHPMRARLPGGASVDDLRLDTPGFVRGYCRMHPDESFSFLVVDAQHFAYVDDRSNFALARIPIGAYRISATNLDGDVETTRVDVTAGETTRIVLRPPPTKAR